MPRRPRSEPRPPSVAVEAGPGARRSALPGPVAKQPGPSRATGSALASGSILLAALVAAALAAPWLAAGHLPDRQLDPAGSAHRPPLTTLRLLTLGSGERWLVDEVRREGDQLLVLRHGEPRTLALTDLAAGSDPQGTAVSFPLGSDRFGRDLWTRLLHGARVSLLVAALALALAVACGTAVGALAALGPPWLDQLLMRLVDALLAFPRLFLLLLLAALWQPGLAATAIVLGATGWMDLARLVRSELAGLAQREFVLAARAAGVPTAALFARHLLPNLAPLLAADAALRFGDALLFEAGLGFLGLGVQPPTASWGTLLADGRETVFSAWWMALFPGLAVTLAVLACGLIADGLGERRDRRR